MADFGDLSKITRIKVVGDGPLGRLLDKADIRISQVLFQDDNQTLAIFLAKPKVLLTPEEVLDTVVTLNGVASPLRSHLRDLMFLLWLKGESFDAKRPFGNSYWQSEIRACFPDHFTDQEIEEMLLTAIKEL